MDENFYQKKLLLIGTIAAIGYIFCEVIAGAAEISPMQGFGFGDVLFAIIKVLLGIVAMWGIAKLFKYSSWTNAVVVVGVSSLVEKGLFLILHSQYHALIGIVASAIVSVILIRKLYKASYSKSIFLMFLFNILNFLIIFIASIVSAALLFIPYV